MSIVDGSSMHNTESGPDDSTASKKLALAKRFPTTKSLFLYHGLKAKLMHLQRVYPRGWDLDSHNPRLREETEIEWINFDLYTEAEWAELRFRLLKGDESYLRWASAAHLFRRGCARIIRRDGMGRSKRHLLKKPRYEPMRPIEANDKVRRVPREDLFRSNPNKQQSAPPRRSVYKTIRQKHHRVCKPKRTIFVRLPTTEQARPFHIADACRSTLQSYQESVCEDARIRRPGICVVRLRSRRIAWRLLGRHIGVKNDELRVLPYPADWPQGFVAETRHDDPYGLSIDSVHAAVSRAVRDVPFYLRTCFIEDEGTSVCMLLFKLPVKLVCLDVGVWTVCGRDVLVRFDPVAESSSCMLCRGDHAVMHCNTLVSRECVELPEAMQDARSLCNPPILV